MKLAHITILLVVLWGCSMYALAYWNINHPIAKSIIYSFVLAGAAVIGVAFSALCSKGQN